MDGRFERATPDGARGLGELLRDLAHGSTEIMRGEIKLARLELGAIASGVALGTAQVALGAVLLLLGGLALLAGLILLVGDQWVSSDRYWLAALIVTLLTGALATWFAK